MTNLELAAAIAAAPRLSLDEARALGFSIDYPAHPRGVGAPCFGGPYGTREVAPIRYDHFIIDPLGRGGFLRGEGWTIPIRG